MGAVPAIVEGRHSASATIPRSHERKPQSQRPRPPMGSRQPARLRSHIMVSSIKLLAGPIKDDILQRATFVGIRHAREASAWQFPDSPRSAPLARSRAAERYHKAAARFSGTRIRRHRRPPIARQLSYLGVAIQYDRLADLLESLVHFFLRRFRAVPRRTLFSRAPRTMCGSKVPAPSSIFAISRARRKQTATGSLPGLGAT
jgi:hypothetical protein